MTHTIFNFTSHGRTYNLSAAWLLQLTTTSALHDDVDSLNTQTRLISLRNYNIYIPTPPLFFSKSIFIHTKAVKFKRCNNQRHHNARRANQDKVVHARNGHVRFTNHATESCSKTVQRYICVRGNGLVVSRHTIFGICNECTHHQETKAKDKHHSARHNETICQWCTRFSASTATARQMESHRSASFRTRLGHGSAAKSQLCQSTGSSLNIYPRIISRQIAQPPSSK